MTSCTSRRPQKSLSIIIQKLSKVACLGPFQNTLRGPWGKWEVVLWSWYRRNLVDNYMHSLATADCIYIYTYIYTYTHTYDYVCIATYIHTYTLSNSWMVDVIWLGDLPSGPVVGHHWFPEKWSNSSIPNCIQFHHKKLYIYIYVYTVLYI